MKKIFCFSIVLITIAITLFAQPGSVDIYFNPGSGINNPVTGVFELDCILIQSDGKIIIGGFFSTFNGAPARCIARLNSNGSLDNTFMQGTGANNAIACASMQSDGKIIIGGLFTNFNGSNRYRIARLNVNGTLDSTFNPGSTNSFGNNDVVRHTSIQSDGKVIVCGRFTDYSGYPSINFCRLNSDGSFDHTFQNGTVVNSGINISSIQSDGKIIIGGSVTNYNGTPINRLARLFADGSLDTTFNVATEINMTYSVNCSLIQNDGKIIIGGDFSYTNGITAQHIARLNTDGSLDTTFNPGTGADNVITKISTQSDGKILISGYFTSYNGIARKSIARLNADGSIDTTFSPGTGTGTAQNTWVYCTAIQSDGKIIVGGNFNSFNGTARNGVARLQNDITLDLKSEDNNINLFPNPTQGMFTMQFGEIIDATVNIYNCTGQLISKQKNMSENSLEINLSDQPNGLYIVEVIQKSNSKRFKISKQ
ncbi:MAG: T9SS type A sorting domain-containing protein [Bacteroidota bacterium]|jgi:uncharacterized delta-60 repeat protein